MSDQDEHRPDPDALLARVKEEEARQARGKLKIFLGAAAGVGKTYAMLEAAHARRAEGVDVVIGWVDTHGRAETEALIKGLEILARRPIEYHGTILTEFDLDAALTRHPTLILVDELAHTNVPGARHTKRWQDVQELLDAGITVYTTLNVQHLESLNDVVAKITGVRVHETIPDAVIEHADEVELVDLPPEELLQRLKEGKVYVPEQAQEAIRNFFRKGNLIALRELALRRTAERVDADMQEYRREQAVAPVWQTREALMACVGPGDSNDRVVRAAARLAGQLDVPWHAVYVETPALQRLGSRERERILQSLKLAQDLGAQTATLAYQDGVEGVVGYARDHNLARVLVGRDRPKAWRLWHRHFAERLGRLAPDLEIVQVAHSEAGARPGRGPGAEVPAAGSVPLEYVKSAVACALAALLATPLLDVFDLANIVMIFLLTVLGVAARYGRGPAVLAAFLAVGFYDFFFVPPRFSFAVSDVQYLLTFVVMLAVGLTDRKSTRLNS